MTNSKDTHVVEIPIDEEHQHHKLISTIKNHPLMEISHSPGHLLLLKLLQREEHLSARRITIKETRKDTIGREIFQLCFFFFIFHSLFSIILFTSTTKNQNDYKSLCEKWWVPSILSVSVSIVVIFLVQIKLWRYWKVERELQRERSDGRAVTRWIQEMRMKGASFDLSKERQSGKRMKSSSVEIKWKPITWFSQNLITVCLVCFAGLVFPVSKLILRV
ncbi:hypothetical protein LOK49_LG06G00191 [Camellia lanceoleosa]|uniref:Uncharacterized protein n=1 Tax=Camellia lanceoleosa TaxID=1840588 RepID=A0ACC0H974_9ERIC|nr:hypothetical protein LOK49_LG06G00191 [Camellia lanceoleosa]